jgi:CHAT domain-containing protein
MVSLWEVDDETTALLMQQFYQQLAKGLSPAKALEQAKDTIRQQHPQPYYWAPFVLIDASK